MLFRGIKAFYNIPRDVRDYLDSKGYFETEIFLLEHNPGVWYPIGSDDRLLREYGASYLAEAFYLMADSGAVDRMTSTHTATIHLSPNMDTNHGIRWGCLAQRQRASQRNPHTIQ
jgi:hypothetical protein